MYSPSRLGLGKFEVPGHVYNSFYVGRNTVLSYCFHEITEQHAADDVSVSSLLWDFSGVFWIICRYQKVC